MFWIILTVAATAKASSPNIAPAAATAPVESIVPPSQAPPSTLLMPKARMAIGITTIMITVKTSDSPIASDSSERLALQAAAVAIAAETPQTDISAEITMLSVGDPIRRIRCPNQNVPIRTIGVTTQDTNTPGNPNASKRPNRTSAPSSTRPVLM